MKFDITHRLARQKSLNFSGEFPSGSKIALLGKSGAGKTTLLRYLAGLETNSASTVVVENALNPPPHLSSAVYMHQSPVMFSHHTVEQTLQFARQLKHDRILPINEWLDQLGLSSFRDQPCNALSGGQQQRVALLRALASGANWLLLDESFSALDGEALIQACDVVSTYCQLTDAGLILASHNDAPQRYLCDQAYSIVDGHGAVQPSIFSALNQQSEHQVQSTLTVSVQQKNDFFLETQCGAQAVFLSEPKRWTQGEARITIAANDISLTNSDEHITSMVNRLQGTVRGLSSQSNQHVLVELSVGGQTLHVLISQWSSQRLKLELGQTLFAEFKVGAVQWHGQLFA